MTINLLIIAVAALVPLAIGFAWYHPKVFGKAWMKAADLSDEKLNGANMPLIFVLTYVFSFFIAFTITGVVIHQNHFFSILVDETGFGVAGSKMQTYIEAFMAKYGNNFRTFKHGALHGAILSLFGLFPLIAINALFERRGFKYIMINGSYWLVSSVLMGGIICQFS